MLSALCGIIILAGINRKLDVNWLRYSCDNGMRVTDYNVVLLITPLAILCLWGIFSLVYNGTQKPLLIIMFILGTYLLGTGFGMHEPTNFLVVKYRATLPAELKSQLAFFDDDLGHWIFFAGFILISLSGVFAELETPFEEKIPWKFFSFPVLIGVCVGVVIFLNMVKERTVLDILVILCVIAILGVVHFKKGFYHLQKLPLVSCLYIAYGLGSLGTLLAWLIPKT